MDRIGQPNGETISGHASSPLSKSLSWCGMQQILCPCSYHLNLKSLSSFLLNSVKFGADRLYGSLDPFWTVSSKDFLHLFDISSSPNRIFSTWSASSTRLTTPLRAPLWANTSVSKALVTYDSIHMVFRSFTDFVCSPRNAKMPASLLSSVLVLPPSLLWPTSSRSTVWSSLESPRSNAHFLQLPFWLILAVPASALLTACLTYVPPTKSISFAQRSSSVISSLLQLPSPP